MLKGCFGNTRIEPTDVDGLVERNGHFLVLEAKKPGVKIKQGQLWTFNALRNTGLFTILILWGEKNMPQEMQVLYPKPLEVSPAKPCDINDVRRVVTWWFNRAEKLKRGA